MKDSYITNNTTGELKLNKNEVSLKEINFLYNIMFLFWCFFLICFIFSHFTYMFFPSDMFSVFLFCNAIFLCFLVKSLLDVISFPSSNPDKSSHPLF